MKIRSFFVAAGLLLALALVLLFFLLTPESGWVALFGLLASVVAGRIFWWHIYNHYDRTGGNDYGQQVRVFMNLGLTIVCLLAVPSILVFRFSSLVAFVAGLISVAIAVVGSLKVTRWY